MVKLLLYTLLLPLILPSAYINFPRLHGTMDAVIQNVNLEAPSISVSNLNSILEVAIGINLALTFLHSFSGFLGSHFKNKVNDLDPSNNATLMEAMNEATRISANEFHAELDSTFLVDRFILHLTSQMEDFKQDAERSAKRMQGLGVATAALCFLTLIGVAHNPTGLISKALFWALIIGIIMPILAHLVTLFFQYTLYYLSTRAIRWKSNGSSTYDAFIRNVFAIYNTKKKNLNKSIEVSLGVNLPTKNRTAANTEHSIEPL